MSYLILLFLSLSSGSLLNGLWKSELGSTMQLQASGGVLNGLYQSAVGNATGTYQLVGLYNRDDVETTLGFCVAWRNEQNGDSRAATGWSGFAETERTLSTTWILTESPLSPQDQWRINTLNTDTFHKQ